MNMYSERTDGILMPARVREIIRVLQKNGYEGYAVGGCVRDSLLGRQPHDWDITTSALPGQVKELFPHTVDTGIAHGTVTVLTGGEAFEVTTYRVDGEYKDARHPSSVTFTPSLEEDLKRRDFTINAMAYSDETGLVDLFDGTGDLSRRVVRCVGQAQERFTEDALRIMRSVRFAAQLGFSLDEETARAAAQLAPTLEKISAERIRDELLKLIGSDRPGMIDTARRLGITRFILPEFDALFALPLSSPDGAGPANAGDHTLAAMENVDGEDPGTRTLLRLTMLLHDMGKAVVSPAAADALSPVAADALSPTAEDALSPAAADALSPAETKYPGHAAAGAVLAEGILRRLRLDNRTVRAVTTLIRTHTDLPEAQPSAVRRMMHEVGRELFPLWLQVKRADVKAQSGEKRELRLERLDRIEEEYARIEAAGDAIVIADLAISGRDLIADGMPPGRMMGDVLERLLDEVLEDPGKNTREYLLERSRQLQKKG